MKKVGIIAASMIFIAATVMINIAGQNHLNGRIAAGDKIISPICAVNMMYDQQCETVQK